MLKIRLARCGKKNAPFFRVVLTEHTAPPKSGYKEVLGYYDPIKKIFVISKKDIFKKYMEHGAQCSDTVKKLISRYQVSI